MKLENIFITGAPRSGTSALYFSMAASRDMAYPDIFLRRAYERMRENQGWVSRNLDKVRYRYKYYGARISSDDYVVDPAQAGALPYEDQLKFLNLEPHLPQEGVFIWAEAYRAYAAGALTRLERPFAEDIRAAYRLIIEKRPGRSVLLDKQPHFLQVLPFLRANFPNAALIHIIRDGRAVVNSIAYAFKYGKRKNSDSKWWGPRPLNFAQVEHLSVVERACHQWVDNVHRARQGRGLFGSRYFEIRYEDFVRNPGAVVRSLIDGCGLPSDALDVDFPPYFDMSRNDRWKAHDGGEDPGGVWTRRSAIDKTEVGYFHIMEPLLRELGYV